MAPFCHAGLSAAMQDRWQKRETNTRQTKCLISMRHEISPWDQLLAKYPAS
jgi:hypothetical protein